MICNYVEGNDELESTLFVHFEGEAEKVKTVRVDTRCFVDLDENDLVVSLMIIYPGYRWPILELVQAVDGLSLFQMLALEDLEGKWQELVKEKM